MNSQAGILCHLGIPSAGKRIKRSSLSYASNKRGSERFKGVFKKVPAEARGMTFTCFIPVIKTILFQRISLWEWLMKPIPPAPKPVLIQ
jgi:hypothetical protein